MKPWTRWLLYIGTLPNDLLFWFTLFVVRWVWGESGYWQDGVMVVRLAPGSWPVRTWYKRWGGTTIAHAVMLNGQRPPERIARTFKHELVHVEQFEANALASLVIALGLAYWIGWLTLFVWIVLPWMLYGASMLTAFLRGEDPYRGSHLEESAYAQNP